MMQITERVLLVSIGAVCIFSVAGLLMGWSADNFLLIISFIIGTFFPSVVARQVSLEKDD